MRHGTTTLLTLSLALTGCGALDGESATPTTATADPSITAAGNVVTHEKVPFECTDTHGSDRTFFLDFTSEELATTDENIPAGYTYTITRFAGADGKSSSAKEWMTQTLGIRIDATKEHVHRGTDRTIAHPRAVRSIDGVEFELTLSPHPEVRSIRFEGSECSLWREWSSRCGGGQTLPLNARYRVWPEGDSVVLELRPTTRTGAAYASFLFSKGNPRGSCTLGKCVHTEDAPDNDTNGRYGDEVRVPDDFRCCLFPDGYALLDSDDNLYKVHRRYTTVQCNPQSAFADLH